MNATTVRGKLVPTYGTDQLLLAWFAPSAAIILATAGIAKTWSAFGHAKYLLVTDPITRIQFGHLMLAVGILEVIIACICLFSKLQVLSLALVAWLATGFVLYRFGLWLLGWQKPCSCLGNLTDALHIPPQTADMAMKIILAYLLIGSYANLFWLWRQKRKALQLSSSEKAVTSAS
jgi:hypothetical protein